VAESATTARSLLLTRANASGRTGATVAPREKRFCGFSRCARQIPGTKKTPQRHKLDRKITARRALGRWKASPALAASAPKARVRAAGELRQQRSEHDPAPKASHAMAAGGLVTQSGKARGLRRTGIAKSFSRDPGVILSRSICASSAASGICLCWPNGAGKKPQLPKMLNRANFNQTKGTVVLGTDLKLAVFDQTRSALIRT